MPKVSTEYLENKKELFLQAALAVCKIKPLYEVTMKDIIRESKISQGGIYRYYSNVDEILVEVINRCSPNADYRQKIDDIIENSRTPKEAFENLFSFMGDYMQSNVTTIGKILFELTVLMANYPARGRKIQSQIKDGQSSQYFITRMSQVIRGGIASGYFHPVLPEDNILSFVSIAIDGIAVNGALLKSYGVPQRGEVPFDVLHLMNTFKTSVLLMLNPGDEEGGKLSYE